MPSDQFMHDPYAVFRSSVAPTGLYARQKMNALAHLDISVANEQTQRAFDRRFSIQSTDGSWGGSEREWCTFLAVHALRNKVIL